MSDQKDFIIQIQQKEKEVQKMLDDTEKSNGQRIVGASEDADQTVLQMEEGVKKIGHEQLAKSKEEAKSEFKKVLVEFDNKRRDTVEGGKNNISKATKLIHESVVGFFN